MNTISVHFNSQNNINRTLFLRGTGGIGKTQLSLEYAYQYSEDYDWIWWVSAETESAIVDSYKEFAIAVDLLDKKDIDLTEQFIIETVTNWMDTHSKWLFIYDNVMELDAESSWFPKDHRANILITTRNHNNHLGISIDVTTLTPEESCLFLKKRTQIEKDSTTVIEHLAERLGFLPLALEQAAAYIKSNECSFEDYVNLLTRYGLDILEEIDGIINYNEPVTATWKISIDKISNLAAKQLLTFSAYLASETIYQELFTENNTLFPAPLKKELSDALRNNKLWKELLKYSLLSKYNGKYKMHRLLQEVIRTENKEDKWLISLLEVYCECYKFDYNNQKKFFFK
ncbi:NB-ARC domain-containing protein [uncultured Enterococcus sp.]|uniref:NB-ARC domain-containing protein n=1 Tax=uncultured Enterococcus sp. TaxID=167972 RepID=UPI002AA5EC27|nr:NB-ARC domain-containing protein [uncultured Enterococcus sp.]